MRCTSVHSPGRCISESTQSLVPTDEYRCITRDVSGVTRAGLYQVVRPGSLSGWRRDQGTPAPDRKKVVPESAEQTCSS